MKIENAFVGARCVDSLPFSNSGTMTQAAALKATGVDCFIGYLGAMTPARLALVLAAGLAFMPVTFAGEYNDGAQDEVLALHSLGIPPGATVWLDLEGLAAYKSDPVVLAAKINAWADKIKANGWMPGLYVGAPQPFTAKELYSLHVVRYWWGLGRCVDRFGNLAEPPCGWCLIQQYHGQKSGMMWKSTGVFVDTNGVQCDYQGRLPVWVVG